MNDSRFHENHSPSIYQKCRYIHPCQPRFDKKGDQAYKEKITRLVDRILQLAYDASNPLTPPDDGLC